MSRSPRSQHTEAGAQPLLTRDVGPRTAEPPSWIDSACPRQRPRPRAPAGGAAAGDELSYISSSVIAPAPGARRLAPRPPGAPFSPPPTAPSCPSPTLLPSQVCQNSPFFSGLPCRTQKHSCLKVVLNYNSHVAQPAGLWLPINILGHLPSSGGRSGMLDQQRPSNFFEGTSEEPGA